jgi:hypothetical protein
MAAILYYGDSLAFYKQNFVFEMFKINSYLVARPDVVESQVILKAEYIAST